MHTINLKRSEAVVALAPATGALRVCIFDTQTSMLRALFVSVANEPDNVRALCDIFASAYAAVRSQLPLNFVDTEDEDETP